MHQKNTKTETKQNLKKKVWNLHTVGKKG